MLKQAVQWRPQQLPELIEKLRDIVTAQYVEADRALCGRGDMSLMPSHAKHRLTVDVWQRMKPEQRMKASDAAFRLITVPTSSSTDGSVVVATTPGGGKKMHQRKRMRSEKTTTKTSAAAKRLCVNKIESDSD